MPQTASDSQIASPTHIAARKGSTSRWPRATTRDTRAAMLGPGEPAATNSAVAKRRSEAIVTGGASGVPAGSA